LSLFDLYADRVYHLSLAYTDVVDVAFLLTGIDVRNIGRVTIDILQGIVTDRLPEQ
jgi:hypothetical protein